MNRQMSSHPDIAFLMIAIAILLWLEVSVPVGFLIVIPGWIAVRIWHVVSSVRE